MIRFWKYILPLMAVLFFASCSSDDEVEIIPRKKMADIYMEMFMTDQWISDTPGMRMIADTSLVYEPILERYGYNKLDYIHSVDFYMNDPERFARILRSCMDNLDKRIASLEKMRRRQELEEAAAKTLDRFRQEYSFNEYFPYMNDEPYNHYYDSLTFEVDSFRVYRLVAIETADTLFEGLEMVLPIDSLFVSDTMAVCDTVMKSDPMEIEETDNLEESRHRIDRTKKPVLKGSVGPNKELNTSNELWQQSR